MTTVEETAKEYFPTATWHKSTPEVQGHGYIVLEAKWCQRNMRINPRKYGSPEKTRRRNKTFSQSARVTTQPGPALATSQDGLYREQVIDKTRPDQQHLGLRSG